MSLSIRKNKDESSRADLRSESDVRRIVDAFYQDIERDAVLGPFFREVDLAVHRERMVVFWTGILFHTADFRGRPFSAHEALRGLEHRHFVYWLARFDATVDALFEGPAAEQIKERARRIAFVFQWKLGLIPGLDAKRGY